MASGCVAASRRFRLFTLPEALVARLKEGIAANKVKLIELDSGDYALTINGDTQFEPDEALSVLAKSNAVGGTMTETIPWRVVGLVPAT